MPGKDLEKGESLSKWLDKHDMLERFHISSRTLFKWRDMGLPCSKVSGKLFFRDKDVETFLQKHQSNEAD